MALTVKVEIPDSWAGATIDGVELEILEDEGGKYVYVDMLPGTSVEIEVNGYDASADSGALLVG